MLGLSAVAACQVLAGLEERKLALVVDGGGGDAGGDAAPDPCTSVGVPPRPTGAPGPDTTSLVFALTTIDFGLDAGPTGPYGFNLDKTCTCPGAATCVLPDGGKVCDVGNRGVDNNGNLVFKKAADLNFVTQDQLNFALSRGQSGALLRIDNYNGQRDDSQARLAVFSSLGLEGYLDGGVPKFNGLDRWTLEDQSVLGRAISKPKFSDETAWVTANQIVGALDFPITIGSQDNSPVTIELTGGVIVATLGVKAGLRTLSGTFSGRWEAKRMLLSFQSYVDPLDTTKHVCGDSIAYQGLKSITCGAVDIARTQNLDNTGSNCDALAVGIHFEAVEAQLGTVASRPDGGFPCGADWSPSCTQ